MPRRSQTEVARELLHRIRDADARARALGGGLSEVQLAWSPPSGGWGVGQVFEHLCVSHDDYLQRMRPLVPVAAPTPTAGADAGWSASWTGALLVRSLRSARRLPAPRTWRPAAAPRPDVVAEFRRRHDELAALVQRSVGLDWTRLRMGSPASRLVRVNLGDAFWILATHAERHLRQAFRVRDLPDFPAAPPPPPVA